MRKVSRMKSGPNPIPTWVKDIDDLSDVSQLHKCLTNDSETPIHGSVSFPIPKGGLEVFSLCNTAHRK